MNTPAAHIGASIRIKGDISASEPLTIAGRVEGSVTVEGHALTIASGSHVSATVSADTILVAGDVKGRLNGVTRIVLRETAAMEGEMSAPSVSVADGATVQGRIETKPKRALALAS
jgi:cytoskeletal protein CcmA (bactofilin family)